MGIVGVYPQLELRRSENGQGLVEFSLGLVLVAVVALVSVAAFGDSLSDTYCVVTEAISSTPNDACYEEAVQEGDGPLVFKPKYNSFNNGFTITAKLIGECSGDLQVVGYGPMTQHGDSDRFSLTIYTDPPPDMVTVGSDSCGWTTVYLN
jgi:Flp pilus assembly pilin Flp